MSQTNKLVGPVEVYESDFPSMPGDGKQLPKRLRRMSKRKLKQWLARQSSVPAISIQCLLDHQST